MRMLTMVRRPQADFCMQGIHSICNHPVCECVCHHKADLRLYEEQRTTDVKTLLLHPIHETGDKVAKKVTDVMLKSVSVFVAVLVAPALRDNRG